MRKLPAAICAATLVVGLAGVTAAEGVVREDTAPAAVTGYVPPPIEWGRCADPSLRASGARCGELVVPLDYDVPTGPTIRLAVSRVLHTSSDADYQGVMLTNPGGPGGSGTALAVLGAYVPRKAGAAYDWIGFDPRGVGASKPALTCDRGYFGFDRPAYVPRTKRIERIWLRRSSDYARACANSKAAGLLDHVKTVDTVQDMESLRIALGREQINFYGFSYGTYLAQVYATLHPDRVRRFVLDSNVNPGTVWYEANLEQNVAFDRAMDVFWRWVARHNRVFGLGKRAGAIRDRYYRELRRLDRHPAGGKIGPAELSDVMLDAGYFVFGWEQDARAYANWMNNRNPRGLIRLYRRLTSGGDNGFAMYLATECTDVAWPQDFATWRRDHRRIHREHPFLTWGNAWYNSPCLYWPAEPGTPVEVDGSALTTPILLISETRDAATPYSGSLEVRRRFPTASLIAGVGGTTHAGSLFGVGCVDNAVARYLRTGLVPARLTGRRADLECPHVPRPVPGQAQALRSSASMIR